MPISLNPPVRSRCVDKMLLLFSMYLFLGIHIQETSGMCLFNGTEFLVVAPVIYPYDPNRLFSITACGEPNTTVTVQNPSHTEFKTIQSEGYVNFALRYDDHAIKIKAIKFPIEKKSFRVTSDKPVGVYVYTDIGDGYTAVAKSSDRIYVTSSAIVNDPCMSFFAVAAYDDNTALTISLRINENVHEAQFHNQEYSNGATVSETINSHDVYFVHGMNDITGTRIETDKPISVFSGADCACIPPGKTPCQGIMEQMIPNKSIGFNTLPFTVQTSSEPTYFRAIALKPDTSFSIPGEVETILTQRGRIVEWSRVSPYGDLYNASKHVLPVQLQPGGPSGTGFWPVHTTIIPHHMFTPAHQVLALNGYNTEVVIIIPASETTVISIMMDGQRLEGVRQEILHPEYMALVATIPPGVHILWTEDGQPTAVYVYGYGQSAAYSFHGACWEMKLTEQTTSSFMTVSEAISPSVSPTNSYPDSNAGLFSNSFVLIYLTPSQSISTQSYIAPPTGPNMEIISDTIGSSPDEAAKLMTTPLMINQLMSSAVSTTQSDSSTYETTQSISYNEYLSHMDTLLTESGSDSWIQLNTQDTVAISSVGASVTSESPSLLFQSDSIQPSQESLTLITLSDLESSATNMESPVSSMTTVLVSPDASVSLATCSCSCKSLANPEAVSNLVDQMRSSLILDKHSLGLYVRKHNSAQDERPSAKGVGYVGVIIIVISVLCFVLGDVSSVIYAIKGNIRR